MTILDFIEALPVDDPAQAHAREDAHPEFAEAMEMALDQALAWLESKAQKSLNQKHFQAGMLNKMMASRYPREYGDRVVHAGEEEAPLTAGSSAQGASGEIWCVYSTMAIE